MDINYDFITFISKYLYFKKAWGNNSCLHHQSCNFFIKTIFKDSRKVKGIRNYVSNMQSVHVFLDIAKFADLR